MNDLCEKHQVALWITTTTRPYCLHLPVRLSNDCACIRVCVCVVCLFWWLIRAARQGICSEVNEGWLLPFLFPSKKHFLVATVVRASRCTWPSASGSSPGYADSLEALLLLWLPSFRSVASDCGSEAAAAAANGFCEAYEQREIVRRPKHIKEHFWSVYSSCRKPTGGWKTATIRKEITSQVRDFATSERQSTAEKCWAKRTPSNRMWRLSHRQNFYAPYYDAYRVNHDLTNPIFVQDKHANAGSSRQVN